MFDIELGPVGDLDAVGKRWRELEKDSEASFFQSWTFLGCLAEERFGKASLLSVRGGDKDLALALIGHSGKPGYLNETGDAVHDAVFIEHNALLTRRGASGVTIPALRYALEKYPLLNLSGIPETMLRAIGEAGWFRLHQTRAAPFATLDAGQDPLTAASANLRSQINRAHRHYGADVGLDRAQTQEQALAFFAELVVAHQTAWRARGKPGAFANPHMLRFHETLIRRGWPGGEVDVLRIAAGARHIGSLYNFVKDGRVCAYQSGFVYGEDNREKPGLLCHALAMRHYAARGLSVYDFLAGADRYKMGFADGTIDLHWASLYRPWSIRGLLAACRQPNIVFFEESKWFFFSKKHLFFF
jgi:CelD/BcsL family acetyltransferase involved in cellulose biosynthesis